MALLNKGLDGEMETTGKNSMANYKRNSIKTPIQGLVEHDAKNLKTDTPEAHADSKSQSSTQSPGATILSSQNNLSPLPPPRQKRTSISYPLIPYPII